jgi:hypothetical protein
MSAASHRRAADCETEGFESGSASGTTVVQIPPLAGRTCGRPLLSVLPSQNFLSKPVAEQQVCVDTLEKRPPSNPSTPSPVVPPVDGHQSADHSPKPTVSVDGNTGLGRVVAIPKRMAPYDMALIVVGLALFGMVGLPRLLEGRDVSFPVAYVSYGARVFASCWDCPRPIHWPGSSGRRCCCRCSSTDSPPGR